MLGLLQGYKLLLCLRPPSENGWQEFSRKMQQCVASSVYVRQTDPKLLMTRLTWKGHSNRKAAGNQKGDFCLLNSHDRICETQLQLPIRQRLAQQGLYQPQCVVKGRNMGSVMAAVQRRKLWVESQWASNWFQLRGSERTIITKHVANGDCRVRTLGLRRWFSQWSACCANMRTWVWIHSEAHRSWA